MCVHVQIPTKLLWINCADLADLEHHPSHPLLDENMELSSCEYMGRFLPKLLDGCRLGCDSCVLSFDENWWLSAQETVLLGKAR